MSARMFEFAEPRALLAVPNGAVVVKIQPEDMETGERFSACGCPIGLALARLFGLPAWSITVGNGDVQVRDNSGRLSRWWRMDEVGRGWRVMWDAGKRDLLATRFRLIPQPVSFMDAADVLRLKRWPSMARVTNKDWSAHEDAEALLSLSRALTDDEVEHVLTHWSPHARHNAGANGAFFTPMGLGLTSQ